ncbi:hypothetical protein F4819DRAFT_461156 [Hypoxylon fuscum]|nr:hypothetical protein F4819DRAFT_461156 [Hypoxylon fuscum]
MADDRKPRSASQPDKKKSHKKQKRHRETDGVENSERKHKKSKSSANIPSSIPIPEPEPEPPVQFEATLSQAPVSESQTNGSGSKVEKKKKRKHRQENHTTDEVVEEQVQATQNGTTETSKPKKEKKSKERKRKHKSTDVNDGASQDEVIPNSQPAPTTADDEEQAPEHDPMDIDEVPADAEVDPNALVDPFNPEEFGQKPEKKEYPFFTQTVSQYLALYPSGLAEPVESFAKQHLAHLVNHYVTSFRGVLLDYRNPRVGERPDKGSLTEESGMDDMVLLESINEYAVTFGWLTVEVDLFRPTRGAWMEGIVNLQGEGHIGVICFDKFNASIEAGRLPHGWHWVDLLSKDKDQGKKSKGKKNSREKTTEEAKLPTPEPVENPEDSPDNDTTQMHTTGYWADDMGTRVRGGAKLYFRIKHYEVGVSGDYGYLSIEGTMLDVEAEKARAAEEREKTRKHKLRHGGVLRREQKRLPEFSMTKFGVKEAEENETQRNPVQWVAPQPGSDTE